MAVASVRFSFLSATLVPRAISRASKTTPNVPEPRQRPRSKRSRMRSSTSVSYKGPSASSRRSELVDALDQGLAGRARLGGIDAPARRGVLAVDAHHAELARR